MQLYNIDHPTIPGEVINPAPYCAQLFNPRNQPWGFTTVDLPGHRPGFPIWFDINLSHEAMHRWIDRLDDGLYFDPATATVTAEFVTYNAFLKLFSKTTVLFKSSDGGAFTKYSNVNTLKVQNVALWLCKMLVLCSQVLQQAPVKLVCKCCQ
jgi:hypothetical protein